MFKILFFMFMFCSALGALCGAEEETTSGVAGWWGERGFEAVDLEQCATLDRRPGLTLLHYKHPKDIDHPDEVSIVNSTMETFSPQAYIREGGSPSSRLLGYIHPLGIKLSSGEPDLHLSMSVVNAVGVLKVGTNDTVASLVSGFL